MRQVLTALVLAVLAASPALADVAVQKGSDPAHGSTAPAPGVSPPASKTVVPEIPADGKPAMEKVSPGDASSGSGSGTSGTSDPGPSVDPVKPPAE